MANKLRTLEEILNLTSKEIDRIIDDKPRYYLSYPIRKKSGKPRFIDAPQGKLKLIQKTILKEIFYRFSPYSIAHGFVHGRSPISNAKHHVNTNVLVNLDVMNFFNSITQDRVVMCLDYIFGKQKDVVKETDNLLYQLSELLTYKGRVPQGASTSPTFSNLVCLGMDKDLKALEPLFGCVVTRYADDITASSGHNEHLPRIIPKINGIVRKHGFRLNYGKTRVRRQNNRMVVTGIVVNKRLNISKKDYRQLRAKFHNMIKNNVTINNKEYEILKGKIEWIRSLHPNRGCIFQEKLSKLILKNS